MAALLTSDRCLPKNIFDIKNHFAENQNLGRIVAFMQPHYLIGTEAPVTKLPQTFPKTIDETLVLGLDIGIGSCGQALISLDQHQDKSLGQLPSFFDAQAPSFIRYVGVRSFDVPEENSTTGVKLKNPDRRAARLLRRSVRRRAARMFRARNLLKRKGVLPADYHIDKPEWRQKHEMSSPWIWRAEGLTRKLDAWEWAASLLHFAKHRGFKSNKKSDLDSKGKDGGTLQSSKANHEALQQYQSVAEMMLNDPRFKDRLRNRAEDYRAMVLRADLEKEITMLFDRQRFFGNPNASEKLEAEFLEIFNQQKPLQNPYALLGECPFEKCQKRGSRFAYSFELSRALQKLNTLTLVLPGLNKVFLKDHVAASTGGYESFIASFGSKRSISWKDLRKLFSLDDSIHFLDLPTPKKSGKKEASVAVSPAVAEALRKDAEKSDFVTRSNDKGCAQGSYALRKVFGEDLWTELLKKGDFASLDNSAFCLTFFESPEAIFDVLKGHNLHAHLRNDKGQFPKPLPSYTADPRVVCAIEGDFNSTSPSLLKFSGPVSLSAEASRKLIPHLAKGMIYSDACALAGYQHTESDYALKNIVNPVVTSVLREVMKQVVHVVNQAGAIPGSICVELGRDLGKSIDERNETARGIKDRTDERNENRSMVATLIEKAPEAVDDEMLLRYELWDEQSALCPYCGETLPVARDCVSGNDTQIDHILPRSRSHDNSFNNKALVHAKCNQDKKSRTPAEWLGAAHNSEKWQLFVTTVHQMPRMKQFKKKRYLLNETFSNPEEAVKFLSRNLNDTRYISKVVLEYLKDLYRLAGEDPNAKGAKRRVFAQPGTLTSLVRKAWGLENLKKDIKGSRIDDKHHAVDALVCACLSEGQRQWITRGEQMRRDSSFCGTFENLSHAYLDMEGRHEGRLTPLRVPAPWEYFRRDVVHALEQLNVSRRESRKGKGQLHQETFYQMEAGKDGEPCFYTRKSLIQQVKGKPAPLLKNTSDLEKVKGIKDPKNEWLMKALSDWIAKGSPTDDTNLPRNPAGTIIRKVTVDVGSKSARLSPHGYVVGGNMVCVDVFSKAKKKSKAGDASDSPEEKTYYLVPVYSYHLKEDKPPMRAIVANKPEEEWDIIDETCTFEFSLWPNSLFEVQKKPTTLKPLGEYLRGYYRGANRDNAKIEARDVNNAQQKLFCSVKQGCIFFRKLNIDRLGQITRVKGEQRVWRGKVCT